MKLEKYPELFIECRFFDIRKDCLTIATANTTSTTILVVVVVVVVVGGGGGGGGGVV